MKIALICQPFDRMDPAAPKYSLEIWTQKIAQRLCREHQVTVYARALPNQPAQLVHQDVTYRRVSCKFDRRLRPLVSWAAACSLPRRPACASGWYFRYYAREIAQHLADDGCDVAHVINFSQFMPIFRKLCPQTRTVLQMQCEWLNQFPPGLVLPRLRATDLVLGCSQYITNRARQRFAGRGLHFGTLHNGVDVDAFFPPGGQGQADISPAPQRRTPGARIVFIGRLSPEKGPHVLLEAFSLVSKVCPGAVLSLIGPDAPTPLEMAIDLCDDPVARELTRLPSGPDYYPYLQQLAEKSGGQVHFLGHIAHDRLLPYLHQSDVFVFPSVWNEPFGMPVAEAMAAGSAVVATAAGGIPEILEQRQSGLLVPPGDARALAQAILELICDRELAQKLRQNAITRARELFSWDVIAQQALGHYRKITSPTTRITTAQAA